MGDRGNDDAAARHRRASVRDAVLAKDRVDIAVYRALILLRCPRFAVLWDVFLQEPSTKLCDCDRALLTIPLQARVPSRRANSPGATPPGARSLASKVIHDARLLANADDDQTASSARST
jgi:hypothetical protein